MKDKKYQLTALNLWGQSYILAVFIPALIWLILGSVIESCTLGLFFGVYSLVLHTVSYGVLGIPLFIYLLRCENSGCWSPTLAVIIGSTTALLAGLLIMTLLLGGIVFEFIESPEPIFVLLLHGSWTGLVASRTKKKLTV